MLSEKSIAAIQWSKDGLIPAIIQDAKTRDVLMMAYMDAEALKRTLEKGETIFWSRSRQTYWHKGETSGNVQKVLEIRIDCDADTLLIFVESAGAACHTGQTRCFYRTLSDFEENPVRE